MLVEIRVQLLAAADLGHVLLEAVRDFHFDLLELLLEALGKFTNDSDENLFLDLLGDFRLVGACLTLVKLDGLTKQLLASRLEVHNRRALTLLLQLAQVLLDQIYRLGLDLAAAIVGHHFTLVWKVQFLLVADDVPGLIEENSKAVDRQVCLLIGRFSEENAIRATSLKVEPLAQGAGLLFELGLLEELVRKQNEIELEEILKQLVFVLFWLVNTTPKTLQVANKAFPDSRRVLVLREVTQYEQQLLLGGLVEELQVALEDDL